MSITIDSLLPGASLQSMSPDQAASLYNSISQMRSELWDLNRVLHHSAFRAINDPKFKGLLQLLKKLPGPKGVINRIPSLRRDLTGILHALKSRMSQQGGLPEPASKQRGTDTGADIEKILRDPSLSLEEKLMMLSATMAAKLESEIEAKMEEWAKLTSGSQGSGSSQALQGLISIGGNLLMPGIGGLVASQLASGLLGGGQALSQDDKNMKGKQLETQIQLLMQRLNRMTSMVSTLMQDDHKTKSGVISNMRV
ncbi:MAG: hypothetical protein RBU30_00485 [Polyangia bacterium]|jgi:hypothetical protein|nr:hypothetical protein [Polyangia bacterium]